jgi:hypothetical protein
LPRRRCFPRTSEEAPGGVVFDDVVEQPADVSFVLDSGPPRRRRRW